MTGWVLAIGFLLALTSPAAAQLRPLDPLDWLALDTAATVHGSLGFGVLLDQRASLAGTAGPLLELGSYRILWRHGLFGVEVSGTVLRSFRDRVVFAEPASGTRPPDGRRRVDTGDHRISTIVGRLDRRDGFALAFRFGTRLPTTDDRVGLERDRTDFFALIAGRAARGALAAAGELGVGIHGSRDPRLAQSDVLLYAASVAYEAGAIRTMLELVGQADGLRGWSARGNEDLGELRASVQLGRRAWVRLTGVRGLRDYSPRTGLMLTLGWGH